MHPAFIGTLIKGKHSSQLFCLFQSFCSFIENGEKLQLLLIIGTR